MMKKAAVVTVAIFCAMFLVAGIFTQEAEAASPSETVSIQGTLENAIGAPLPGSRKYDLTFWSDVLGGSQLGPVYTGMVDVSAAGRFVIQIEPLDASIVNAGEVWYELAIESEATPDGNLVAGDIFPERVLLGSVPKALNSKYLSGKPAEYYKKGYAIVSPTGPPFVDYANLKDAVDGGETKIFVMNGIYAETGSIEITKHNVSIIGQGRDDTIIDLSGAPNQRMLVYSTRDSNSTGTVDIDPGVDPFTVTGTGTLFQTAGVVPGDIIILDVKAYTIKEVTSETTLILDSASGYHGPVLSGYSFEIVPTIRSLHLENLTIRDAEITESPEAMVVLGGGDLDVSQTSVSEARIYNCRFSGCDAGAGVAMTYGTFNVFRDCIFENNLYGLSSGLGLEYVVDSCLFEGNSSSGLGGIFDISVTVKECQFNHNNVGLTECQFIHNEYAGASFQLLAFLPGVFSSVFDSNVFRSNEGPGLLLSASSSNVISNNIFSTNGDTGLNLEISCDRNAVTGNVVTTNGLDGIAINNSDCDNNVVTGNMSYDNAAINFVNVGNGTVAGNNYAP
jgi:parallel beta-helix repeat protein